MKGLVLLVLAVAVIGLGMWAWLDEGPLYWWVMTKRVCRSFKLEGSEIRGWDSMSRFEIGSAQTNLGHLGTGLFWYTASGFLFSRREDSANGRIRATFWHEDGTVEKQMGTEISGRKTAPPWLWGVTDQTEPTMPEWMKDDEKWAEALEEAR